MVGIGYAAVGLSNMDDYKVYCYDETDLNVMVGTGVLGMLGHVVAAVFYLRSATTAAPATHAV